MKNFKLASFIVAAALLCTLPSSLHAGGPKFSFSLNLAPVPPPFFEECVYLPCPPPYFERPVVVREYYCSCCGRMRCYQRPVYYYPPHHGYYAPHPMW